jgi:hypothetical protein
MEERDVQVRGYKIRLPGRLRRGQRQPEDYTSRGRIITRSKTGTAPRSALIIPIP